MTRAPRSPPRSPPIAGTTWSSSDSRAAAPLDVFVVRKLGVPGHEELAMGAIASGGWIVLEKETVAAMGVNRKELEACVRQEAAELARREQTYREGRPAPELRGRTVILVDDGLATGSTMRAAVKAIRDCHPATLVVAVPVGSRRTREKMLELVDDVVCLCSPEPFRAVGLWYADFTPTSDEEVRSLLHLAPSSRMGAGLT
jgi:putative phosphoribosyl transferase